MAANVVRWDTDISTPGVETPDIEIGGAGEYLLYNPGPNPAVIKEGGVVETTLAAGATYTIADESRTFTGAPNSSAVLYIYEQETEEDERVVQWSAATEKFQPPGSDWLGGDSACSVDVGTKVLWLFADTFIAKTVDKLRSAATLVKNSVGVQTGYNLASATIAYFWRQKTYETEVLARSGLVAYWKLNETVGTTAEDFLGTNDGTIAAGVTLNQATLLDANPSGKSFDFTAAAGARITAPDAAPLDLTTGATVAAWIRPDNNNNRVVLAKVDAYHMGITIGGTARFTVRVGGVDRFADGGSVAIGTTYHMAGTYDATTGDVKVYLNGLQVGTFDGAPGNIDTNASQIEIGAYINSLLFDGRMAHVQIYNRALTAQEVWEDYSAGKDVAHDIFPFTPTHYFWPLSGILLSNGKLLVLGMKVDRTNPLGIYAGWTAFVVSNPTADPTSWSIVEASVYSNVSENTLMTLSPLIEGTYLYLYGKRTGGGIRLARFAMASVLANDLTTPQWWTGSTWSASFSAAADMMDEPFANEGTVMVDGEYRVFHAFGYPAGELGYRKSARPTSFPRAKSLYRPPESDAADALVYAFKAHPEQVAPRGALVVTYIPSYNTFATIVSDLTSYRPKVLLVRLSGKE